MLRDHRPRLIGILSCTLAVAFESSAVLTAMPAAAADLGDLALYAWVFTGFVTGMMFAIVAAGRWADRSGPAVPLAVGLAVFALGLVISALAPSMLVLLVGRTIQGLGGGTIQISQTVVLAHGFPPAERPRVMTWFSAAWLLPSLLGPGIAAWLASAFSWHAVFWSVLPVVALAFALLPKTVGGIHPAYDPAAAPPVPLWAAGLVAVGAAGLQYAGQVAAERQWSLMAAGLVAAAGLAVLPRLLPHGESRDSSRMTAAIGARTLSSGAFFGAQTFLTLWLVQGRGLSLLTAGALVSIGSIGWMLGSWLQARPWLGLRRDQLVTVGAGGVTAGVLLLAATAWLPALWLGFAGLGWVLCGFGMGLLVASTSLVVMHLSSPREQGRNASSLQVGEALGGSLLAGAAGTWYALTGADFGPQIAFGGLLSGLTAFALVSVAVAMRIGPLALSQSSGGSGQSTNTSATSSDSATSGE